MQGLAMGTVLSVGHNVSAEAASLPRSSDAARPLDGHRERVLPGIWKMSFGTAERATPVSMRQFLPAKESLAKLTVVEDAPVSIKAELSHRGCVLRIPLAEGERVYGLGLQLYSHEQRGKKKVLRVNADPHSDSGDTHAPVPFFVTTRGYGVFIDTARYATFYVDALHTPEEMAEAAAEPPRKPSAAASSIVIEIENVAGAEAYIFAGPSMKEAVQRYNLFSGGGCLPPDWGLGFWYRVAGDSTQERVMEYAKQFRERRIPCDVIGLEPGWQSHAYSCTFVWSSVFPDPKSMIQSLQTMLFKTNLWEHAFTHPTSPLFDKLNGHAGNYAVFGGRVPDFAEAATRQIFGDYHKEHLVDLGVSGFKLDECDNSDFTGSWSFPELSRYPSGLDGEQMHSVFGLRYQDAILGAFSKAGKPTYSLVRCSGSLAAPYPFVLYSDLYDHRVFIRALVNSGFSGLLWCPEVRNGENTEDLIRRLQSVVFSPVAMVNAWYIANPPWKQVDTDKNNRNEFAENWQHTEDLCREIIGWRMQLVPYLKAAFERYHDDGTPPFRALVMDYPHDERLSNIDDQFLVGDRMLVAPVFAGQATRRVTLPVGRWCDFWTGETVEGGGSFEMTTRLDRIPVYVKWGSVFPIGGSGSSTQDPATRQISVRVYGDGSLPFLLGKRDAESGLQLSYDGAKSKGNAVEGASGYSIQNWEVMR